ncbi:MAG: hypothetical protein AAGG02_11255 [Cyanobacteria bacterium P01_H01_bin.15]
MAMFELDYPEIVMAFQYRGWQIELDRTEDLGVEVFSVWANNERGSAVAVPFAMTRKDAIKKAKRWVDGRLLGIDCSKS